MSFCSGNRSLHEFWLFFILKSGAKVLMLFVNLGQEIERNPADSALLASTSSNVLEKANLILLTKHPTARKIDL